MNSVFRVLARIREDLEELEVEWALIGGLAVAASTEPRTTRDVDVAIAADDEEAEALVRRLMSRGYRQESVMEHELLDRLALVRLVPPMPDSEGTGVDLLFAFAGIEDEIVRLAKVLEILPGLFIPVARLGHLLALKVYADRDQDRIDGRNLILAAGDEDLQLARDAVRGIALNNNLDDVELARRLEIWIADASR